jgi:hypothetical protein
MSCPLSSPLSLFVIGILREREGGKRKGREEEKGEGTGTTDQTE